VPTGDEICVGAARAKVLDVVVHGGGERLWGNSTGPGSR